jgi:hypothetical protein
MKIEINIENKQLLVLILLLAVAAGISYVIAQGGTNYPNPGHPASQIGPGTFSGAPSDSWTFPGYLYIINSTGTGGASPREGYGLRAQGTEAAVEGRNPDVVGGLAYYDSYGYVGALGWSKNYHGVVGLTDNKNFAGVYGIGPVYGVYGYSTATAGYCVTLTCNEKKIYTVSSSGSCTPSICSNLVKKLQGEAQYRYQDCIDHNLVICSGSHIGGCDKDAYSTSYSTPSCHEERICTDDGHQCEIKCVASYECKSGNTYEKYVGGEIAYYAVYGKHSGSGTGFWNSFGLPWRIC